LERGEEVLMAGHDIIVVGSSAGGIEALKRMVRGLPGDLPAAMFVASHLARGARSHLADILGRDSALPVDVVRDGEPIRPGRVTLARPDHHLLLDRDRVRSVHGPRVNLHRPAVDPLFRSASRAHGARVIGAVLSGTLDDGASGLQTIHERGGVAVVQEPDSALFSSMPERALENVPAALRAAPDDLGALMGRLAREPAAGTPPETDEALDREFERLVGGTVDPMGEPSPFACPDCSGVLWQIEDHGRLRYQCRIGHGYSADSLIEMHGVSVEDALWAALRALEENADLNRRVAERLEARGNPVLARRASTRGREAEGHAGNLRRLLATLGSSAAAGEGE
jgi:two-component system chemotaxis response regulator CheB